MEAVIALCVVLIVANIGPAHLISVVTGDYKNKEPVVMVAPEEKKEGSPSTLKEAVEKAKQEQEIREMQKEIK